MDTLTIYYGLPRSTSSYFFLLNPKWGQKKSTKNTVAMFSGFHLYIPPIYIIALTWSFYILNVSALVLEWYHSDNKNIESGDVTVISRTRFMLYCFILQKYLKANSDFWVFKLSTYWISNGTEEVYNDAVTMSVSSQVLCSSCSWRDIHSRLFNTSNPF